MKVEGYKKVDAFGKTHQPIKKDIYTYSTTERKK